MITLLKEASKAAKLAEAARKKSEARTVRWLQKQKTLAAEGAAPAKAAAKVAGNLNNPPRDTVDPRVVHHIALMAVDLKASQANVALLVNGSESLNLENDLKIKENDRIRLSASYTIISESYGGSFVGSVESKNATTVQAAIDLVHAKANKKANH